MGIIERSRSLVSIIERNRSLVGIIERSRSLVSIIKKSHSLVGIIERSRSLVSIIEKSHILVGSAFGFGRGDPSSMPSFCITLCFLSWVRILTLSNQRHTHGIPTLWGKAVTILKISHWLSDAIHIKQDAKLPYHSWDKWGWITVCPIESLLSGWTLVCPIESLLGRWTMVCPMEKVTLRVEHGVPP